MQIVEPIKLYDLWNEEWFQLSDYFITIVEEHNIQVLIPDEYPRFIDLHQRADKLLEIIKNSPYTEKLTEKDLQRDDLYYSLRKQVKANTYHIDLNIQLAAKDVMRIFNHYGNVPDKSYDQETALLYNFIQEIRSNHYSQINTMNLQPWINQLERYNNEFKALFLARLQEKSELPTDRMVDLRKEKDACYYEIIARLEAIKILRQDPPQLTPFFNKLNVYIHDCNIVLAKRKGRRKKDINND